MREISRPSIDPAKVALVIALLLSFHSGDPNPTHIALWIAIGVVIAISTRRHIGLPAIAVGLATIAVLLIGAIAVRLAWSDRTGSDVLFVTRAAIDRVVAGFSPYGHAYQSSNPPGAPFPYGPLAVLLYMPFHQVEFLLELLSGFVVASILAIQGRLIGLAVYAAAPILVSIATDGSNDTTLGLLILAAFMTARKWPLGAGFLLACAVAFKLFALAFAPGFFLWAGVRATLMFVAGTVMTWSPVLAIWGIPSFLDSLMRANDMHSTTKWSLGVVVQELTGKRIDALDQLRFVAGALISLLALKFRRSMDAVILVGVAVYLVTLYGGNWGSFAYFGGIAPIVCWRLDDWLGFPSQSLLVRFKALRIAWRARRERPRAPVAPSGTSVAD